MTETVIQAQNLAKRYFLGKSGGGGMGYQTLRESVMSSLRAPLARLRRGTGGAAVAAAAAEEEFWALRDVSFEIKRGEVVGIIGRNGAGKSTLLKILSRITEPTKGRVSIRGRVASLLEVGTGFHPELTGRENIFLNGAILGMHRHEIRAKFDEIVAFAEVERFLDTPVKRYSSGMYVRLAFAVAAHLEPEILVVDEVLAVGDLEFQRKCLGKMESVSRLEGRTVIFVSHNLGAVRSLCTTGILLAKGRVVYQADAASTVDEYLTANSAEEAGITWEAGSEPSAHYIRFRSAYLLDDHGNAAVDLDNSEGFTVHLEYELLEDVPNLRIGFFMQTAEGTTVCGSNNEEISHGRTTPKGVHVSRCRFPGHILNAGTFYLGFGSDSPGYDFPPVLTDPCLYLQIVDHQGHGPRRDRLPGLIRPQLRWDLSARPESVDR